MSKVLDFDGFLEKKNIEKAYFIFLLEGEKSYLEADNHWVHHSPFKAHVVRMNVDEFNMLEIGRHPKVIQFDHGKELKSWNGVPDYETLLEEA